MTTADPRWERLRELFARARTLPAAQREAFLSHQCDDPELRREAAALLDLDDTLTAAPSPGFLQPIDRHQAAALLASWDTDEAVTPDEVLGRYRVIRRLGQGGMGIVYLAHDPLLDRSVALKLLPVHLSGDETANRALAREARAASATEHPNIATVHDVGETGDGRLFIVMSHYEGVTLGELLRRGPVPVRRALTIARQVVAALAAAHARGIVHRDIKPGNLLLTPDGGVKVLDFGIAMLTRGSGDPGGGHAGTAGYMSPEQTRCAAVDGRSDLWAVGVVLWEMLVGTRPFVGPDPSAIARSVLEDHPRLPDSVPQPLRALVHRCLDKEPDRRFPDAAALLRELERLEVLPGRVRPGSAALAAAGLVALLGLGWLLLPSRAARSVSAPALRGIAVVPLVPVTSDTALELLGRELAVTLAATLGSVVDGGVIDPQAVLAAAAEGPPPRLRTGAAGMALRLGAGRVLHGSLLRVGRDSVRVEADLLELPSQRPIAHTAASASAGDLLGLTDSVTLGLLRGLWREGDVPAPSLGGIATTSIEALRHYLDGERAFARGEFAAAVTGFERAFALDSTFWMAYWRSLYPRVYEGTPPAESAKVHAVLAHRTELPLPDRALMEAITADGLHRRLAAGRHLTRAHPSYWPGWYEYGNTLLHDGPYLGTDYEQSRVAFEQVVRLQPRFTPAWVHLFWIAVYQRDTVAAGRALARVRSLASPTSEYVRPGDQRYDEALLALLRGGGDDDRLIAREAAYLAKAAPAIGPETLGNSLLEFGFARAQIALADALLALGSSREVAVELLMGRGRAWASRGAWDSALASSRRGARLAETPKAALATYALAAVGSVLGGLESEAAATARRGVERLRWTAPADSAELHWLDGVAAFARRDAAGLERARRALAGTRYEHADLLAGSLAGLARAAAGDSAGAGRSLADLEEEKVEGYRHAAYAPAHPWLSGINRLLGARFLLATGAHDRPARLLTWHEAVRWGATNREEWVNRTLEPLARLERARIDEDAGLAARAADHYAAVLERFDLPSPALEPLRREAAAGLARVSGRSSGGGR
ncbi:MAG TPA: serine/threonine-protein kinase [Gemmatimonadales bacterium]